MGLSFSGLPNIRYPAFPFSVLLAIFIFGKLGCRVAEFPAMAKEKSEMVSLNAKISPDLRRRLLIAKANTGKGIGQLITEWIEAGLAKIEGDRGQRGGRK